MDPPPYADHHDYKAVPASDEDADADDGVPDPHLKMRSPTKPSFLKRHLATILIVLLSLTTLLLLLAVTAAITLPPIRSAILLRFSADYPNPRPVLHCGNTTAEAEAQGCEYDPLAACWLHPDCPHDYSEEFMTYNDGEPFHYYYDQAKTRRFESWDELAQLGYYWSSTREHLVHCSFIIRRGQDTRARGARVDSMVSSLHHVDHCAEFLADQLGKPLETLEEMGTYGEVGFLEC